MKSNEEFIAGIYRKAEAARLEIEQAERKQVEIEEMSRWQHVAERISHMRVSAWLSVRGGAVLLTAVAACLVLVLQSGKLQTGKLQTGPELVSEQAEDYGIALAEVEPEALSQEPAMMVRTVEPEGAYHIAVKLIQAEELDREEAGMLLRYQVIESGEELELTLTAEELELYYPEGVEPGTEQVLWLLTEEKEPRLIGVE